MVMVMGAPVNGKTWRAKNKPSQAKPSSKTVNIKAHSVSAFPSSPPKLKTSMLRGWRASIAPVKTTIALVFLTSRRRRHESHPPCCPSPMDRGAGTGNAWSLRRHHGATTGLGCRPAPRLFSRSIRASLRCGCSCRCGRSLLRRRMCCYCYCYSCCCCLRCWWWRIRCWRWCCCRWWWCCSCPPPDWIAVEWSVVRGNNGGKKGRQGDKKGERALSLARPKHLTASATQKRNM